MKALIRIKLLLFIFYVFSCGSAEPINPYEDSSTGGAESITATHYTIEHKILGKGADSSFIIGTDKPLDLEVWLWNGEDVVAKFPLKWRLMTYGLSVSLWGVLDNLPKLRNFAGKSARDLLGSFSGLRTGVAIGYGQTSLYASNSAGVELRMIFDRVGLGFDASYVRVLAVSGTILDDSYSWSTIIDMVEPKQNW